MNGRKNELISGVEYWRCKRKIGKDRIKKILGGNIASVKKWSRPDTLLEASNAKNLIRVADCLDVTVDQLFEIHSTAELEDGDRLQFASKYNSNLTNCLCSYRISKGLSYQQLAKRMGGISPQRARAMCGNPIASKAGIARISRYEKMSPDEFERFYGQAGEEA